MKVMIDIPKEFEEDLKCNFQDFFNRMIADITYYEETSCCSNYDTETAEMFLSAFEKATIVSDNATNGDKIKGMFPDLKVEDNGGSIYVHYPDGGWIPFDREWWYAPYKKEVKE